MNSFLLTNNSLKMSAERPIISLIPSNIIGMSPINYNLTVSHTVKAMAICRILEYYFKMPYQIRFGENYGTRYLHTHPSQYWSLLLGNNNNYMDKSSIWEWLCGCEGGKQTDRMDLSFMSPQGFADGISFYVFKTPPSKQVVDSLQEITHPHHPRDPLRSSLL